jgi:hypothetical protein
MWHYDYEEVAIRPSVQKSCGSHSIAPRTGVGTSANFINLVSLLLPLINKEVQYILEDKTLNYKLKGNNLAIPLLVSWEFRDISHG